MGTVLTDDALGVVFSFLTVADMGRAARVCRRWRDVSRSDVQWNGRCEKFAEKYDTLYNRFGWYRGKSASVFLAEQRRLYTQSVHVYKNLWQEFSHLHFMCVYASTGKPHLLSTMRTATRMGEDPTAYCIHRVRLRWGLREAHQKMQKIARASHLRDLTGVSKFTKNARSTRFGENGARCRMHVDDSY